MYCSNCGSYLPENSRFCSKCGNPLPSPVQQPTMQQPFAMPYKNSGIVGFSPKINHPAFAKYIKNTNRWSVIFSFLLAIIAVIGFFIYGERSSEMNNPQALFIGLGIGSMFIVIAIFQVIGRKTSKTWDGMVVDKKIEQKRRRQNAGNNDYYWEDYTLFTVFIRCDRGKVHKISVENDDTVYNYYQIGDRVRHHGGLNSYEKYDKSRDTIIFCNACATLNDISNDVCSRCKCPLLK